MHLSRKLTAQIKYLKKLKIEQKDNKYLFIIWYESYQQRIINICLQDDKKVINKLKATIKYLQRAVL